MKLTNEEIKAIEELFDISGIESLYGGNIHSYMKEVEQIKDMSENELRAKYPTAFYWFDKWRVKVRR